MAVPKRKQQSLELAKGDPFSKSKAIIEDKKSGEYRLSHHMDLKLDFTKVDKFRSRVIFYEQPY